MTAGSPGVDPSLTINHAEKLIQVGRKACVIGLTLHFGLTPRRFQSEEHNNPGRISKAGDRGVRATLYAAANALLMRTMAGSQIKSWGMRLMRIKGRRRAVVVVARKRAVLRHRKWVDGSEFCQEKVGNTACTSSLPPNLMGSPNPTAGCSSQYTANNPRFNFQ
ncbi:transposase [Yoonia sp.]|uniref:transposase n=1 Tax=Yoonia sp. TaxID=2212373 RepID=UPI0039747E1E